MISDDLKNQKAYVDKINLLVLCPFCIKEIPMLTLLPSKGNVELLVKCSCLDRETKIDLKDFLSKLKQDIVSSHKCDCLSIRKATKYCLKCFKYICNPCIINHDHKDKNEENPNIIICKKHNKKKGNDSTNGNMYCSECRFQKVPPLTSIPLLSKEDFLLFKNNLTIIDKGINNVKKIKGNFVKRLNIDSRKNSENEVRNNKLKNQILSLYKIHLNINQDLKELVESVYYTGITMYQYPSIQLTNLFQFIEVDNAIISKNIICIDKYYEALSYHLSNRYVIKSKRELLINPLSYLPMIQDSQVFTSFKNNINQWAKHSFFQNNLNNKELNSINIMMKISDKLMVTCSKNGSIRLWDINKYICVTEAKSMDRIIIQIITLKNIQAFASISIHGHINLWDNNTLACKTLANSREVLIGQLVELTESRLLCTYDNSTIEIWNYKTCQKITKVNVNIKVIEFSQLKNRNLISFSEDQIIRIWHPITFNILSQLDESGRIIELNNGDVLIYSDSFLKIYDSLLFVCKKSVSTVVYSMKNYKLVDDFTIKREIPIQNTFIKQLKNGNIIYSDSKLLVILNSETLEKIRTIKVFDQMFNFFELNTGHIMTLCTKDCCFWKV